MAHRTRRATRARRAAGLGPAVHLDDEDLRELERAFDDDNPYHGFAEEGEEMDAFEEARQAEQLSAVLRPPVGDLNFLERLEAKYSCIEDDDLAW